MLNQIWGLSSDWPVAEHQIFVVLIHTRMKNAFKNILLVKWYLKHCKKL